MRKLIESILVSLGAMFALPEHWSLFDKESSRWSLQQLDNYEAVVMGRVTYEYSRDTWGSPPPDAFSASGSMRCPNTSPPGHWAKRPGTPPSSARTSPTPSSSSSHNRERIYASGAPAGLDDTLLRAALIDELPVWFMPVVVGAGQHLFYDIDTSSVAFTLTHLREFANGSVIDTYTPNYRDASSKQAPSN